MTITVTITGNDWPEVFRQAQAIAGGMENYVQPEDGPFAIAVIEKPKSSKARTVKAAPRLTAEEIAIALQEPPPAEATPEPGTEAAYVASQENALLVYPEPEPVAEDEPPLTYNVLANAILELIRLKGRDAATAILQGYGAATAREVPEARWVDVYNQVKEACL